MSTFTTLRRSAPAAPEATPVPSTSDLGTRPAAVQLRARRSPRLIALGVLLACLGGLGGAALFVGQSHSQNVVVMARTVSRGEVVNESDLSTTTMGSAPGITVLPATSMSELVGRTALVDLPAGSLPGAGSVGTAVVPPEDERMGLRLSSGRVPVSGISMGTAIRLVPVAASGGSSAPAGDPIDAVAASAPVELSGEGGTMLDVVVKPTDAVAAARLAAAGQLYVIVKAQK